MRPFAALLARDLRVALRQKGDVANTLIFFVMVTSLFPLGVGADSRLLATIAPGILWVAALLAATLSFPRLFESDLADGTLEQLLLSGESLGVLVLAKALAHWITTGLLLALVAPVIALQFGLRAELVATLFLALLIGTPLFSLLGAVGSALTLGLRGAGVLTALLLLPLFVPVLIFGAGAVVAVDSGLGAQSHFMVLGALLLFALPLAPWVASAALRLAVDSA